MALNLRICACSALAAGTITVYDFFGLLLEADAKFASKRSMQYIDCKSIIQQHTNDSM